MSLDLRFPLTLTKSASVVAAPRSGQQPRTFFISYLAPLPADDTEPARGPVLTMLLDAQNEPRDNSFRGRSGFLAGRFADVVEDVEQGSGRSGMKSNSRPILLQARIRGPWFRNKYGVPRFARGMLLLILLIAFLLLPGCPAFEEKDDSSDDDEAQDDDNDSNGDDDTGSGDDDINEKCQGESIDSHFMYTVEDEVDNQYRDCTFSLILDNDCAVSYDANCPPDLYPDIAPNYLERGLTIEFDAYFPSNDLTVPMKLALGPSPTWIYFYNLQTGLPLLPGMNPYGGALGPVVDLVLYPFP